jgi:hypothetical protein
VPDEFRAPKVNDIRTGEFLIKDLRTGRKVDVKSAAERNIVLNAMRKGATLEQAAEIAKNAPVAPDGLASVTSSRTPTTTRPKGTSAGKVETRLNGTSYDIEIIKTPDGRTLAVGTGENAGHVFGEAKETSNKLFGDFRREGPWTPPPAKTTAAAATPEAQAPAPPSPSPSPSQAANNRIRSQIANSVRDYLLKTGGFLPSDALGWTSTGP